MNKYNKKINVNLKPVKKKSMFLRLVIKNMFMIILCITSSIGILFFMYTSHTMRMTEIDKEIAREQEEYEEIKELFDETKFDIDFNDQIFQLENNQYDYFVLINYLNENVDGYLDESDHNDTGVSEQLTRVLKMTLEENDGNLLVTVDLSFEKDSNYTEFVEEIKEQPWYSSTAAEETSTIVESGGFPCSTNPSLTTCDVDTGYDVVHVEAEVIFTLKVGGLDEE